MSQPFKICPQCQTPAALTDMVCAKCGRQYRTQFGPPAQQTISVAPLHQLPPTQWEDLARRYRSARGNYNITLILGFLCLWPLWIFTYLEKNKMNEIKREVAAAGVDAKSWAKSVK